MRALAIEDCSATLQIKGNSILQLQDVYTHRDNSHSSWANAYTSTYMAAICEWTCSDTNKYTHTYIHIHIHT